MLTQLHVAIHDTRHESCVDGFSVALLFYQLEHGIRDLQVEVLEEIVPPCDKGELVDLVDALSPLLAFPSDPMPVQVGANSVQHLGAELVFLPLGSVKS